MKYLSRLTRRAQSLTQRASPFADRARPVARRVLPVAIAAVLALGAGYGIGAHTVRRQAHRLDALRAQVGSIESQLATVRAQTNRLRAERNQLEARLAADKAPGICPQSYVSTADAGLSPYFSFDYPCGWNVLRDAQPADATDPAHPGLHVETTFISRLPISLAPKTGPIADIEIEDWTDADPADATPLPQMDTWLTDERTHFTPAPRERNDEGGQGISVHVLVGTQSTETGPTNVVVELWEFDDAISGAHHVVRAFAIAPSRKTAEALDRVAHTFAVLRR